MDLLCPKCLEPVDNDEFHEVEEMSYQQATRLFRREGCGVVFGFRCVPVTDDRAELVSELYDLLGDDMDGAAAMIEDAEAAGLL